MQTAQDQILEKIAQTTEFGINKAQSFDELASIFKDIFNLDGTPVKDPNAYKNQKSDYGLKSRGKKTRELINEQAKEILDRVDDSADLTADDREILLQYSGRGGLTENSQFEYYTPAYVAEGVWDAMKANGYANGNVLDPACGAGVFSGTKPASTVVSGNDLDSTGSKVAGLLNPEDHITNTPFEEIATGTPDNTFDGIVGNVPFGNARGKSAHLDPDFKSEKLIERYFLLRALDKVKPGGLCCLVVPINIVGSRGKAWEEFRLAISKKAEFLGAHKLPSKTFGAQGTDTVVDVVVLKKHGKDLLDKVEDLNPDILWESQVYFKEFVKGQYWKGEGKRFIMGKYMPKVAGDRWSRETVDGDIDNATLKKKLALKFNSRIDWGAVDVAEPINITHADGDKKVIGGTMYEFQSGEWIKVKQTIDKNAVSKDQYGAESAEELEAMLADNVGALNLSFDQLQAVLSDFPGKASQSLKYAVEFAEKQLVEYRDQIVRGSIIGGMIARMSSKSEAGEDVETERSGLQDMIISEIQKYGHPKNNKNLVLAGEGSRMFGMFKNAMDAKGNFSDLLAGTLDKANDGIKYNSEDPEAIISHMFKREDAEYIEVEDVLENYTGERELTLADLADFPGVAITPDGFLMPMYRYCSGDVYPKIAELQQAMAVEIDQRIKDRYQEQISEMLLKVKQTAPEDISFGMQQKWFNREKYVAGFLKDQGYKNVEYGKVIEVEHEDYAGNISKKEQFQSPYDGPDGEFRGLPSFGFFKQFEKYLNGKKITSSKQEYIEEYRGQARSLEEQFNVWMQQHPDIDELAAGFNRKFNGYVPVEHEDTPLGIEDFLNGEIVPHGFQNSEIRRLSEDGRGICGMGTGLGKTFTSFGLAAYDIKKGRSKRKAIVVPNSVLENWYHEARTIYKESFVRNDMMFIGIEPKMLKDGVKRKPVLDENGKQKIGRNGKPVFQDDVVFRNSKQDKYDALWKVPQSNYKIVIMTKETFGMIPLKPENKAKYTDKMVKRALMSAGLAKKINEGKKSYDDDKKIANLEGKYSDEGTKKKQELPYLEDMGFDSVVVDEVHNYKNSIEPGENTRGIAYLPTAPSAQVALDMTMKAAFLRDQNDGRGFIGLSATPVTNSPFEIFNQLALVCGPEEFEKFGVHTVDDFVRVFGDIQPVDKMSTTGDVKQTEGLVGFKNLDGLRSLFGKYVNVKTAKDVDQEIHVPEGIEQQEFVSMDDDQTEIYQSLRARAKKAIDPSTPKEDREHVFSIIREMDRVTTDMDLYNRTMTFVFSSKYRESVESLEEKLPTTYKVKQKDEDGETYFEDIEFESVFKESGESFSYVVPEQFETLVTARFVEFGIKLGDVSHPVTPKYAKMLERLKTHHESGGKQIIFTEEKTQHQKIKRLILNQLGIDENQIGVINADEASGKKLDQIGKAFNGGKIKIIIANKKAEVGVNLQKGTTAIHHLTLPWTPASIEQRNGRGVRQGNKEASVKVYYYCGKGSFDAYRKDLLQAKSHWIGELLTGDATSAKNGDADNSDELLELLAENPEEAKRQRAERMALEKRKREKRHSQNLINRLLGLASKAHVLDGLDGAKQSEHDSVDKIIDEETYKIERTKEAINQEGKDEKLTERLDKQKRRLAGARARKQALDAKYDAKKEQLEAQIKQAKGFLEHQAKEGKLPFGQELIDNPGNAAADTYGRLYEVGKFYEIKDKDNKTTALFKVTAAMAMERAITMEVIIGHARMNGTRKLVELKGRINQCSYSEKELVVKRIEAKDDIDYETLIKFGLDKQTFAELHDTLKNKTMGTRIIETGGEIEIYDGYSNPDGDYRLVFPDPGNESFKKRVLSKYLELDRDGGAGWSVNGLMGKLFGSNYREMAAEYGTKVTEAEILEAIGSLWNGEVTERYLKDDFEPTDFPYSLRLIRNFMWDRLQKLADNADDIKKAMSDFLAGKEEEYRIKTNEAARKEADAEREQFKNNPALLKVLENKDRFNSIGVILKTNEKVAAINYSSFEPFARLFLQDKAFGGSAKQMFAGKKSVQAEWGTKFNKKWPENSGAWWHLPESADMDALYEELKQYSE